MPRAVGSRAPIELEPFGVDIGPRPIAAARRRLPGFRDNCWVAEASDWRPPRRFRYAYTLADCVPESGLHEYVSHLVERAVGPGGRLVVGSYGSRSRAEPPLDVAALLEDYGLDRRSHLRRRPAHRGRCLGRPLARHWQASARLFYCSPIPCSRFLATSPLLDRRPAHEYR